jgi:hypothetical protein
MHDIEPGRYRHFKGGRYEVLSVADPLDKTNPPPLMECEGSARHSEHEDAKLTVFRDVQTGARFYTLFTSGYTVDGPHVVYRSAKGELWARPVAMWNEIVKHEGKLVMRFTREE